MRTTLITSAVAASVLTVGFAATAGAAQSDGSDAAATPTTVPFNLEGLGLTPEQMTCLTSNVVGVELDDMTAVMALMTQCGIDPTALGTGATTPLDPGLGTATTAAPTVTGTATVDPAAAASILLMLGVDPASALCIENGLLAATSPGDDNGALAILQSCGLTLNDLLIGVLAVNDLAAGSSAVTTPTVPGATTLPIVPTTASGVGTDNPLVQQLIDLVRDQYGIELTPEQASCLLDNIGGLNPEDLASTMAVMQQCGISLDDLAG